MYYPHLRKKHFKHNKLALYDHLLSYWSRHVIKQFFHFYIMGVVRNKLNVQTRPYLVWASTHPQK